MSNIEFEIAKYQDVFEHIKTTLINTFEGYKTLLSMHRVYSVDGRVKRIDSIKKKLQDKAYDDNNAINREKILKLLDNSCKVEINQVLKYIDDIVGMRVICFFNKDVKEVIEKAIETLKAYHYKIIEKIKYNAPGQEIDEFWENIGFENKTKPSGYTSAHIIVELNSDHVGDHNQLIGMRCELQFRNLLEEAWGEIEHKSAYKVDANKEGVELFKIFGRILDEANKISEYAYNLLEQKRISDSNIYGLLPFLTFHLKPFGSVPIKLKNELKVIYNFEKDEDYKSSAKVLERLVSNTNLINQFKLENRNLYHELLCELGFAYLKIKNYRRAFEIYRSVLIEDPQNFWANFRISYIYNAWANFEKAIEYAQRAVNQINMKNVKELLKGYTDKEWIIPELNLQLGRYHYYYAFKGIPKTGNYINFRNINIYKALNYTNSAYDSAKFIYRYNGKKKNQTVNDIKYLRFINNIIFINLRKIEFDLERFDSLKEAWKYYSKCLEKNINLDIKFKDTGSWLFYLKAVFEAETLEERKKLIIKSYQMIQEVMKLSKKTEYASKINNFSKEEFNSHFEVIQKEYEFLINL